MKNKFLKSFITLSGSNIAAQAINLITYFILPKFFYSPEDFGVLGMFLPVYFVLFEIVNLKMDQSIMLPKEDSDAKKLLNFSCLIAIFIAVVISILVGLGALVFPAMDKHILYFLGLSLLLGGLLQPILVWLNREGAYFKMGNIRVVQAVATFGISILSFYIVKNDLNGLIIGFIGGQLFALIMGLWFLPKLSMKMASKDLVTQYHQFMKFGTISSMISTLSRNLPAFAIKYFFGYTWLGYYTLATKYLNAPIGIFSTSIGQIYFKEASVAEPSRLKELTENIVKNIFVLITVPTLILLFFGGGIFSVVFGQEWTMAGKILQVLILWYWVAYVSGPLSVLLDVKLKLKWELQYSTALLLFRGMALGTAFLIPNFFVVLGIYAFVGVVFNLVLLAYILNLSREHIE
ncbi:MAG: oligosaccharide flippase family protein [Chitinophagales bacterium]